MSTMQEYRHERPELFLASASPRRREFMDSLGIPYRIYIPETEEIPRHEEKAADYCLRNAVEKARHVVPHISKNEAGPAARFVVVAADTIVVLEERILEKPQNPGHARAMLRSLSGRTHEVMTGLCVLGHKPGGAWYEKSLLARTEVQFKPLTDPEIEAYVESGEPMDKAGAYAIQGKAAYMVKAIRGSYTNVVGLPLSELVDILEQDFGLALFGK